MNNKVLTALAPDHSSQAAYAGRIKQTEIVEIIDENGTYIQKEVTFYISWDTITEVLAMVRKRAGIQL